jgi:hypothetical protein
MKLPRPYTDVAAAWPNGTAARLMGSERNRSTTPRLESRAKATMDGVMLAAIVANRPLTRKSR